MVNRLQELIAENKDGVDLLLLIVVPDRARRRCDRKTMDSRCLAQSFAARLKLKVVPFFADDVKRLNGYSLDSLNVVQEDVDGFHVERESPQTDIAEKLRKASRGFYRRYRLGKSAVLKRFAQNAASAAVIFIKNDRIDASNWHAFATGPWIIKHGRVSL